MDKEDATWIKLWLSTSIPTPSSSGGGCDRAANGLSSPFESTFGLSHSHSHFDLCTEEDVDTKQMSKVSLTKRGKSKRLLGKAFGGLRLAPPPLARKPLELFTKLDHEFECNQCGGKYADKAGLLVHHPCYIRRRGIGKEQREAGGNNYSCEVCGKAFNLMTTLRNHMKFHLDDFNFQCNLCRHQTKVRGDMIKHIRIHTGKRPARVTRTSRSNLISAPFRRATI